MAISFPQDPQEGDRYAAGTFIYEWDGTKWVSVAALSGGAGLGPEGATGATGPTGSTGIADLSSAYTWTSLQTFNGGVRASGYALAQLPSLPD